MICLEWIILLHRPTLDASLAQSADMAPSWINRYTSCPSLSRRASKPAKLDLSRAQHLSSPDAETTLFSVIVTSVIGGTCRRCLVTYAM